MATRAPANGKTGAAPAVRPRSFLVGTQEVIEGGDYDSGAVTIDTAPHSLTPWSLQATGWLRGLWLMFVGTGLTAGTVTADGPFSVIGNIELDDVNNEAIFGPFDGYTAFIANKLGGYQFADDPATSPIFTYTGTVSTNNFTFALWIPLEIVNRDPLGPVASVNNTASLTLKITTNILSNVFTTATGTLSLRVTGTQSYYFQPRKADKMGAPIQGAPPAAGTTQYWTQGSLAIAGSGTINSQLITGLGYPWRQYMFMLRDATGSRSAGETNWPDPLTGLKFEANMLLTNYAKKLWQLNMAQAYGYTNPTADVRTAGATPGKENGVYTLNWNKDFAFRKPGSETRRTYLVTSPGSNFIFNGNVGGAGNLYSIVNYVAPGGGAQAAGNTVGLTGGQ
jgi:hypothetical protein